LSVHSEKISGDIRVLVAERNALSIELLAGALRRCQSYFDVVGYSLTAVEAIKKLSECRPRLALVSIGLQDGSTAGCRVLSHIRDHHSNIGAVALLEDSSREQVLEAFRSGARGVVSREQPFRLLAKSLRKVYEGEIWASNDQIGFVFETLNRESSIALRTVPGMDQLTVREKEVVAHAVDGMSNAEIGTVLGLSEHTVRNYIMKVYDKLGVSNRVQLTRQCVELAASAMGS
jgi:DNA-binding NarL/FixJ family response regulator